MDFYVPGRSLTPNPRVGDFRFAVKMIGDSTEERRSQLATSCITYVAGGLGTVTLAVRGGLVPIWLFAVTRTV